MAAREFVHCHLTGWGAATPDHHCKQAARSTIIFEELRPAESPRFKHTASPRSPRFALSVFRGYCAIATASEMEPGRSQQSLQPRELADAKSSHKVTQDPPAAGRGTPK